MRFNEVAVGHHAYVYVEGPDGQQWAIRAGPEHNKFGANYGDLKVIGGKLALRTDASVEPAATQLVGYFDSYNEVVNTLATYGGAVNSINVLYRPCGPNSNSFAFGAVEALIGFRPESSVRAIGSDVNVKLWARPE